MGDRTDQFYSRTTFAEEAGANTTYLHTIKSRYTKFSHTTTPAAAERGVDGWFAALQCYLGFK
jgi:hypothetical protein